MTDPTQPDEGLRKGQLRRAEVLVRGVVQGVGYRPFVYRLAAEEGLAGSVGNDSDGVTIEIEGQEERVEAFSFPSAIGSAAVGARRLGHGARAAGYRCRGRTGGISDRCQRGCGPGEHRNSGGCGYLPGLPA